MYKMSFVFATFAVLALVLTACGTTESNKSTDSAAELTHVQIATMVLEQGIGGQDADIVQQFVREDYIQHSALAPDGREGLLGFLENGPRLEVNIHRVLSDKDHVAFHTTYTFPDGKEMVAFDVFRVQEGQLAEHWDALQNMMPASETVSGNSMVDGSLKIEDEDKTEANRAVVMGFVDAVLTKGEVDRLPEFISTQEYIQHNPAVGNGLDGLGAFVGGLAEQGIGFGYTRSPLVVAQGNFVLVGSEGFFGPADVKPFAVFYDLFRVKEGRIVEHWDVIPSPAPDPAALPHGNGLF